MYNSPKKTLFPFLSSKINPVTSLLVRTPFFRGGTTGSWWNRMRNTVESNQIALYRRRLATKPARRCVAEVSVVPKENKSIPEAGLTWLEKSVLPNLHLLLRLFQNISRGLTRGLHVGPQHASFGLLCWNASMDQITAPFR